MASASENALEKKTNTDVDTLRDKPYAFMSKMEEDPSFFSYERTFHNRWADTWQHQDSVMRVCLFVLVLYFMFFRERNELDTTVLKSLYETFPSLEQMNLEINIERMREQGLDTQAEENRLKEVKLKLEQGK